MIYFAPMKLSKRALLSAAIALALAAGAFFIWEKPRDAQRSVVPGSFPVKLTDDEGAASVVATRPRSIVSLAPQFTEAIFALGEGSLVVGVSRGETHPPEATAIPQVVAEDGLSPNPVRIFELGADLVLTAGFRGAGWKTQLRASGVAVVTLEASSVEDAVADIEKVGLLIGRHRSAKSLTSSMREAIGRMRTDKEGRTVFVESFFPPLTGAVPGGYLEDLISKAGATALTKAPPSVWTAEELNSAAPRFYVAPRSQGDLEAIRAREGLQSLMIPAGGLISVPDDLLYRPGPRLIQAIRLINSALARRD